MIINIKQNFRYFVTKDRWEGLPLPSGMRAPIYWVDYTDDDIFMRKISGNILELADPVLDNIYILPLHIKVKLTSNL